MPYLNWRTPEIASQIRIKPSAHAVRESQVELEISPSLTPQLVEALKGAFAQNGELRLDLPSGWTLFWKIREGESRLLLAHPDAESWVGTAALNAEHAQVFLQRLEARSGELYLGELGSVARVSNLEIVIANLGENS